MYYYACKAIYRVSLMKMKKRKMTLVTLTVFECHQSLDTFSNWLSATVLLTFSDLIQVHLIKTEKNLSIVTLFPFGLIVQGETVLSCCPSIHSTVPRSVRKLIISGLLTFSFYLFVFWLCNSFGTLTCEQQGRGSVPTEEEITLVPKHRHIFILTL